jgi:hypothetical protein
LSLPLSYPRGRNLSFSYIRKKTAFCPFHTPILEKGALHSVPAYPAFCPFLLSKRREPCIHPLTLIFKMREPCILSLPRSYPRGKNSAFCPFHYPIQEEGTLHFVPSTLLSKKTESCTLSLPLSYPRRGNPALCIFHSPIQKNGIQHSVPSTLLSKRREPCILSLPIYYPRGETPAFCPFHIFYLKEWNSAFCPLIHSPYTKSREPSILSLPLSIQEEGPVFCPYIFSIQ